MSFDEDTHRLAAKGAEKHRRALSCPNCQTNLKGCFHFDKYGSTQKAENLFYCDECKRTFHVTIKEVE
jgi:uncharacterized protein YbaR (Trm112 family)